MCPEISDDEMKQFTAMKEAKVKADADAATALEAKAKADADAKAKADLEAKNKNEPDPSLRDKAAKERQDADARKSESKRLEGALRFNMSVADFVKTNSDIIPSEMEEIMKVAEKETYDSAIEKASALKKAFIESFFAVQSNLDLLTGSQKASLDDWQKLTKNGKEAKAETIFENLFEPALETLKKVKKAEELGKARSGFANSSKVEDGYKARLMASSKKTYLGEKGAT